MKRLGIFGSTGSIGVNALEILRAHPDRFQVTCLSANRNSELLARQALEFRPEAVCLCDEGQVEELKRRLAGTRIRVLQGQAGLATMARELAFDMMVGAIVGSAGLVPTLEAIRTGKDIALANKETLVVAGEIVNELKTRHGVKLIPIDSEHSALFQCMVGERPETIRRLILTASGGPFLFTPSEEFEHITVEQALRHPNWNMGAKITIDSATLINKGLEVIEAHWLFGVEPDKIEVVIHPQSIVHSMVEFVDSSVKAQLGLPDMKVPIQYALSYPERMRNGLEAVDFVKLKQLDFFAPDRQKFRSLSLAFDALKELGTVPAVMNAANEVVVDRFLKKQIRFADIPAYIEEAMERGPRKTRPSLEDVLEADRWAREFVARRIDRRA